MVPTGWPSLTDTARTRSSLNMDTVAPSCAAAAGTGIEAAIAATSAASQWRLEAVAPDRGPPRSTAAVTTADRAQQRRASVDLAVVPLGHERKPTRGPMLANERDQSAHMRRGKGAAVDEGPSTSWFSGWHFVAGGDIDSAV